MKFEALKRDFPAGFYDDDGTICALHRCHAEKYDLLKGWVYRESGELFLWVPSRCGHPTGSRLDGPPCLEEPEYVFVVNGCVQEFACSRHRNYVRAEEIPLSDEARWTNYLGRFKLPPYPKVPSLYRFFDKDGTLLYIGQTMRPPFYRFAEHRQEKAWWHEVARIDIEIIDSEKDLTQVEYAAISAERPRYNIKNSRVIA